MMIPPATQTALIRRMSDAERSYGPFASTHEALGVCLEEWTELLGAVHLNNLQAIQHEALDLAAALLRLHDQINTNEALRARSVKPAK